MINIINIKEKEKGEREKRLGASQPDRTTVELVGT